jgi:mannose-6-phosphate isomerase-like protein (cupin superfamily)
MEELKYGKYIFTDFKEPANLTAVADPQAYFRGARQIPGANMNMGWQLFVKPIYLEKEPHTHNVDEYLVFLGGKLLDLFDFKAEIDFWIGKEQEKHVINKPTIIFIPKGMVHCPLNFRKIDEPILFHAILLGSRFTKFMNGKEFSYDGPTAPGATGPVVLDL